MIAIPETWHFVPPQDNDPYAASFDGPDGAQRGIHSVALAGGSLADVTADVKASIMQQIGADPERTEQITMGDVPAVLLTYHFTKFDLQIHQLEALCDGDRAFELSYAQRERPRGPRGHGEPERDVHDPATPA